MNSISLLKKELAEYKRALEKSKDQFEIGRINEALHNFHKANLEPLIEEYSKAVEILENKLN